LKEALLDPSGERISGWDGIDWRGVVAWARVILFSVQRSKFTRKNVDRIYRMNMISSGKKENDILLIP
jgi:hypothetical protein